MVGSEYIKRFFITFACATFVIPTLRLEGHHLLWRALEETFSSEVNWSNFMLHHLMNGIHEFQRDGGHISRDV